MGFFDLFKKKPTREELEYAKMLNGAIPIFSQFGNDIYASDVVQQAVNCIVREIKKVDPQHIIKNGSDVTPVNGVIQRVLDNPNSLMTTSDFMEKITWNLIFNYNSFIVQSWDKSGKLDALYPIQPTTVDFLQDARGVLFVKFHFMNDYEATVRYSDVIHIRYNYSVNDYMGGDETGSPNYQSLLKTLELNHTMLEGVGKALKSSFAVNGVLKYNTILDDGKAEEALNKLTESLRNNESGFMALDLKGEFIPFERKIALVDATTLKFIDEKILRHFGVPLPILTGDYSKEQLESFHQKTLEPILKSMGQAFTKAIFTRRESVGFGNQIVFYSQELLFLSTTQKLEMIRLLGDSGALYENEKRTMMGLKPLDELQGVRKQSLNYVDVEIANTYQAGENAGNEGDSDKDKDKDDDSEVIE